MKMRPLPGAMALGGMMLASLAFAGDQDFTLVNDTGVEIRAVFVSPTKSDDWEEDILGRDTLEDGDSVDVEFARKEKAKYWDLRIEDGDGNSITWNKLNLLEISKLTLHYDEGKASADAE